MSLSLGALARWQAGAWVLLLVGMTAATLDATLWSDDIPFVTAGDTGEWITAPRPVTADLIAVMPGDPPAFTFVRRFEGRSEPGEARLRGRALRIAPLPLGRPSGDCVWREPVPSTSPSSPS